VLVATELEVPDCAWTDVGVLKGWLDEFAGGTIIDVAAPGPFDVELPYTLLVEVARPLVVTIAAELLDIVAARLFDILGGWLLGRLELPKALDIAAPVLLVNPTSEVLISPVSKLIGV